MKYGWDAAGRTLPARLRKEYVISLESFGKRHRVVYQRRLAPFNPRSRQRFKRWDIGVRSSWNRDYTVDDYSLGGPDGFFVEIKALRDWRPQRWRILFELCLAARVMDEESISPSCDTGLLPSWPRKGGAFYEVVRSEWLRCLGGDHRSYPDAQKMVGYRHYVIFTYDHVFEFIAKGYRVTKLRHRPGYSPSYYTRSEMRGR